MKMYDSIASIHKVELHRHLDCSMRFKTMLEIANELGMTLPASDAKKRSFFLLTSPMESLSAALMQFQQAQSLLHSEPVLERLAFETVQEAALENTKLLELRYSPNFIDQRHPHLSWDQIHQAFLRGIKRAQAQYKIAVGLIIIIQRTLSLKNAESIVDFAINNKQTCVGIDLADSEEGFNAAPFEKVFQRAKAAGLHITVHAGEISTPQSTINIEESIHLLGAERIGHGIQALHSQATLKLLRDRQIPLEVCPTSNYLTQVVPKLEQHPLRRLYDEGILLTINTDDPGIFDYTLSEELLVTQNVLGFSEKELLTFQKIGFDHSFIDERIKQPFQPFFEVL